MGENVQRLKQGEGLWSLYLEFDITLTAFWDFQLFFVKLFRYTVLTSGICTFVKTVDFYKT